MLAAVLFVSGVTRQIVVVVIGLLLIEMGVWKLGHMLFPEEREYLALRAEVDRFIRLVRDLNRAAVALRSGGAPEARERFEGLRASMVEAVQRMAEVAGRTNGDLRS